MFYYVDVDLHSQAVHPGVRQYTLGGSKYPHGNTVQGMAEVQATVQVMAVTCLGVRHPLLARRSFDVCILDEASQVRATVRVCVRQTSECLAIDGSVGAAGVFTCHTARDKAEHHLLTHTMLLCLCLLCCGSVLHAVCLCLMLCASAPPSLQVSLPACLGPLLLARTFVLVGDHYQLPPLVSNHLAAQGGLGVSLFRRLSEAHPQVRDCLRPWWGGGGNGGREGTEDLATGRLG
jgi:hypothetical protein